MLSIEQKRNNPLNNSSSKQLYSFPRSHRFVPEQKPQAADAFYDHEIRNRQASFTFSRSKRMKTDSERDSPVKRFYDIDGEIEKALKKKAGVKILFGREDCKSKGIFQVSETPGPGNYSPNPEAVKVRIASKCSIGHDLRSKSIKEDPLPGPGAYQLTSTLLNEQKKLSKYTKRSYGRIIFDESRPKRNKTEIAPEIRFPEINSKGDITFQKGRGFMIGKSKRFQKNVNEQPGPGNQYVFVDSVKFLQIFCKLPKIDYSSLYILKKTMKRQKKMVLLG